MIAAASLLEQSGTSLAGAQRCTLTARNLTKSFRSAPGWQLWNRSSRKVVDDVSLHVEQGEVVGLFGPNGAGKTTTFNMVVGLLRPDAGSVFLDGSDLTAKPMHLRARSGLGYLPQEASISGSSPSGTTCSRSLKRCRCRPGSARLEPTRYSPNSASPTSRRARERCSREASGGERRSPAPYPGSTLHPF